MKIKDGKIKLDSNEKRCGNFILKSEENYVKIFDINRTFVHSVSKGTPVGMFLSQSYDDFQDEHKSKGIGNYIGVLWTIFSTVPDVTFLKDVYQSSVDCMGRHPEAYGVVKEDSDDAHQRALEDVKDMKELEDEIKKLNEKAGQQP